MREPDTEGSSQPQWPRVMWARPQGRVRSVDRGMCRPGIEPRKKRDLRVPMPFEQQKATPTTPLWRGGADPAWSIGPEHAQKIFAREPGDPAITPGRMQPSGRGGEDKGANRRWTIRGRAKAARELGDARTRRATE